MRYFVVIGLLAFASCSTGPTFSSKVSKGNVQLLEIVPPEGSEVNRQTSLRARVSFNVDTLQRGIDYYVAVLFDSRVDNQTFSMVDTFSDAQRVADTSGIVEINYPIRREWDSGKLKRPIRVWFYLMQRVEPHRTKVLGTAGPIEYLASGGA